jgi:hypothetical protein
MKTIRYKTKAIRQIKKIKDAALRELIVQGTDSSEYRQTEGLSGHRPESESVQDHKPAEVQSPELADLFHGRIGNNRNTRG